MWLEFGALPEGGSVAPLISAVTELTDGDEGRPVPITPTPPLMRAAFSRSFSRLNRGGLSCWCWDRPWRRRLGGLSKPLGGNPRLGRGRALGTPVLGVELDTCVMTPPFSVAPGAGVEAGRVWGCPWFTGGPSLAFSFFSVFAPRPGSLEPGAWCCCGLRAEVDLLGPPCDVDMGPTLWPPTGPPMLPLPRYMLAPLLPPPLPRREGTPRGVNTRAWLALGWTERGAVGVSGPFLVGLGWSSLSEGPRSLVPLSLPVSEPLSLLLLGISSYSEPSLRVSLLFLALAGLCWDRSGPCRPPAPSPFESWWCPTDERKSLPLRPLILPRDAPPGPTLPV